MNSSRYYADVYNGTASVDMRAYAAAGHVVIAHKATEGTSFIDGLHAERSRKAHALGLTVIHYHFARPDLGNDPTIEAQLFVMTVKPLWQAGDYLMLDMERGIQRRSETDQVWVERFCRHAKGMLGATPILYASESPLNTSLARVRIGGERYIPAKYGGSPSRLSWRRHKWAEQYTDGTQGAHGPFGAQGIGRCDMNELNAVTALALRLRTWRRRRSLHKAG